MQILNEKTFQFWKQFPFTQETVLTHTGKWVVLFQQVPTFPPEWKQFPV